MSAEISEYQIDRQIVEMNRSSIYGTSEDGTTYIISSLTVPIGLIITWTSLNSTLSILGNIIVIWLILTTKRLRNRAQVFLVTLATSNLLYGLTLPLQLYAIAIESETVRLPFPGWLCSLDGFVIVGAFSGSTLSLMALALDRYVRVCRSDKYDLLFSRSMLIVHVIILTFISCAAGVIPMRPGKGYLYDQRLHSCLFDSRLDLVTYSVAAVLDAFLPSGIICYCYWQIYHLVKTSSQRLQKHGNHQMKAASAMAKTCFVSFSLFIIFWTPFGAATSTSLFTYVPDVYVMVTGQLLCTSSAINPILYGIFNGNFREEYKRLWYKITRRKSNVVTSEAGITQTTAA